MKQPGKQKPAGQWAKQQQKSSEIQAHQAGERLDQEEKVLSEGAPGENRKPADTIGEVAHADKAKDAEQNKT